MVSRRGASNDSNNNSNGNANANNNGGNVVNDVDPDAPPFQKVVPDQTVQLFLEAAGRACAHIENWFRNRSQQLEEQKALARDHEAFQQMRVADVVQLFRADRPRLEQEASALVQQKAEVQTGIAGDLAAHTQAMAGDKQAFEEEMLRMEDRIAMLTQEAKEATEWVRVSGPPARKQLADLHARLVEIARDLERKLQLMQAEHEDSKRIMRENLVMKLRAVRDAAAADAAAAGGSNDKDLASPTGDDDDAMAALIGKPTTKTNERLTREVAVYVRESLALEHSLSHLTQQEAALSGELLQKQTANEKLVLQNAASAKTKRILKGKLAELENQLVQVERDAESRSVERTNSLVATSNQQAAIIEQLNDEIDHELDALLALKSELRDAQQQRLAQRRTSRAAGRFFLNCGSDFQEEEQRNNSSTTVTSTSAATTTFIVTTTAGDEEPVVLFVPCAAARRQAPTAGSGNFGDVVVSGLGRVDGKKEVANFLMRTMNSV